MSRQSLYPSRIPTHRARARLVGAFIACIVILLLQACGGGDDEEPAELDATPRVCQGDTRTEACR